MRLNNAIAEIIVGENAAAALKFLVLRCNAVGHGWIKLKNTRSRMMNTFKLSISLKSAS